MKDSIIDDYIKKFDDTERKILAMLSPPDVSNIDEFPEANVGTIEKELELSRHHISRKLNEMYREGILERRKRGKERLYRLNQDKDLAKASQKIKVKRNDIDFLEEQELDRISGGYTADSFLAFQSVKFNLYGIRDSGKTVESINPSIDEYKSLSRLEIDKSHFEELLNKDEATIRDLVNVISHTLRDTLEEDWKQELSKKYDELLEKHSDTEESIEAGQEIKDSVIELIHEDKTFESKDEAVQFLLKEREDSFKVIDGWSLVSGFLEPEEFEKLQKVDNAEDFVEELVEEFKEIRAYSLVISERK